MLRAYTFIAAILLMAPCIVFPNERKTEEKPKDQQSLVFSQGFTNNSEETYYLTTNDSAGLFPSLGMHPWSHTVHTITQADILNSPLRDLKKILSLQTGTVLQDGMLHVRGGRSGEIAYFLDGFTGTNPFSNQVNIRVIPEAVETIQLHTGAYSAEYGGGNGALVRTALCTGGSSFRATLDYRTDDFFGPEDQLLGTSSLGFHNAVLTLGGPTPGLPDLRFFIAAQYNDMENKTPAFVEPFRFDGLADDSYGGRPLGEPLPGPLEYHRNYLSQNWKKDGIVQGTLTYNPTTSLRFQLTGSYEYLKATAEGYNFYSSLINYYNLDRNSEEVRKAGMLGFKTTHHISPSTSWEAGLSYSESSSKTVDPVFGDDWAVYTDSLANARSGYPGWIRRYRPPRKHSTICAYQFEAYGTPPNVFEKKKQTHLGASIDFTTHISKYWTLRCGTRIEGWEMRLFRVGNIESLMEYENGIHGNTPRTFPDENARRVHLSQEGLVDYFGYDVDGHTLNSGPNGPRKPLFGSFYLQNHLTYRGWNVQLGLRLERMDVKALKPRDTANPPVDTDLSYIAENALEESEPYDYVLPRVSVSYPFRENTFFYGAYGQYVQMPRLDLIYTGLRVVNEALLNPVSGAAVGFTAKPEKVTQVEIGVTHSLFRKLNITLIGFYKTFKDQLRFENVYDANTDVPGEGDPLYGGYFNQADGRAMGIELMLELKRTMGLAVRTNLTFSKTEGNGTNTRESSVERIQLESLGYPTHNYGFNQPFYGSMIVDYRLGKGQGGKILEGTGLDIILTFSKGHNYTKYESPGSLGTTHPPYIFIYPLLGDRSTPPLEDLYRSTTPWIWNVDLQLKKSLFLGRTNIEFYIHVLNLFNKKHVVNVYPITGEEGDDGWLTSPFSVPFYEIPNYAEFYDTINNKNRLGYQEFIGTDIYGTPRQIRFGVRVEM